MIFKNIKINKKGFALLLTVVITSILLSVALEISKIAVKEAVFSISGKNSNDAFYAADTAIECTLYNDKAGSTIFTFDSSGYVIPNPLNCLGGHFTSNVPNLNSFPYHYLFTIPNINNSACAIISVTKNDPASGLPGTIITAQGYNIGDSSCNSTNPNRVERELIVSY